MIERVDDRTVEQILTHRYLVVGTDSFLSGWGRAKGGTSYAAWACDSEETASTVYRWVKGRSDMKRVRVVIGGWFPRGKGHAHIYVVGPGHPSLSQVTA